MYNEIKTTEDIRIFLDKTNFLHDGYIIGVQFIDHGISKIEGGHSFHPEQNKLVIQVQVTSIWDALVEIEFERLLEWQIKGTQFPHEIMFTSVIFDENNCIVWSDDTYVNMEKVKNGSYAIAKAMRWRIVESNFSF